MEKTYKDGYVEGIKDAIKVIMAAEKDPKDMTRLSMRVTKDLNKLKGIRCK